MRHDRALETLAVAAHSGSVVLHALAVVYHCVTARRCDRWAVMHAGIAAFSVGSIIVHASRLTRESSHESSHAGRPLHPSRPCPDDDTEPMFV